MLAHVSQSSKRLGKLKKYKSKVKPQEGFQFLLQSLERDKENQIPNGRMTLPVGNMVRSVNVEAVATAPSHLPYQSKGSRMLSNGQGWFENVKMLEHSEISEEDLSHLKIQKGRKKKEEKAGSRKREKSGAPSARRSIESYKEGGESELIYKVKQYLALTSELLNSHPHWQHTAKAKRICQQLVNLLMQMSPVGARQRRSCGGGDLLQSVETTAFDLGGKGEAYMRIINSLEMEKEKLNSLISKHQMANIKMYIKINDGESEEIEQCKKQLALLFQKYKTLQGIILRDKTKIAKLSTDKEALKVQCRQHQAQKEELMQLAEQYQEALENIKREGDVVMRSQVERKQEDQEELQYSRKTSRQRDRTRGGKLGINLNSLFQNMSQKSINQLTQNPTKLKQILNECKGTIRKLERTITDQNMELQFSVRTLQSLQQKLSTSQQLVSSNSVTNPTPPCSTSTVTTRKGQSGQQKCEEYRIIALQAAALESAIKNGQLR